MNFNIKKYYGYISSIELINTIIIAILTVSLTIAGIYIFKKFIYGIFGFMIGLFISYIMNISRNIKAEKMKMEIDIYKKIMEK